MGGLNKAFTDQSTGCKKINIPCKKNAKKNTKNHAKAGKAHIFQYLLIGGIVIGGGLAAYKLYVDNKNKIQ